jgi:hypothetical protein
VIDPLQVDQVLAAHARAALEPGEHEPSTITWQGLRVTFRAADPEPGSNAVAVAVLDALGAQHTAALTPLTLQTGNEHQVRAVVEYPLADRPARMAATARLTIVYTQARLAATAALVADGEPDPLPADPIPETTTGPGEDAAPVTRGVADAAEPTTTTESRDVGAPPASADEPSGTVDYGRIKRQRTSRQRDRNLRALTDAELAAVKHQADQERGDLTNDVSNEERRRRMPIPQLRAEAEQWEPHDPHMAAQPRDRADDRERIDAAAPAAHDAAATGVQDPQPGAAADLTDGSMLELTLAALGGDPEQAQSAQGEINRRWTIAAQQHALLMRGHIGDTEPTVPEDRIDWAALEQAASTSRH